MCDFSQYGIPTSEWLVVEKTLPPPAEGLTVEERKAASHSDRETMAADGFTPLADQLAVRDYRIPTRDGAELEARTYRLRSDRPEQLSSGAGRSPVYVHLHGGGFFFGTLASEDGICARLAVETRAVVLNVNYRHTPEHLYPTAWLDVEDALAWVHGTLLPEVGGDPEAVVMGGISAGAQITASLVMARHLRLPGHEALLGLPPLAGQVLMIPCLVNPDCYGEMSARLAPEAGGGSYVQCREAAILPVEKIRFFIGHLKVEDLRPDDYFLNPGNVPAELVKGLPPTVFGIAGLDPLRDEGLLFAKMLAEQGVPTDVSVFPGLPHAFRRFGAKLSESKRWDDAMHGGIKWILSKPTASGIFEPKSE